MYHFISLVFIVAKLFVLEISIQCSLLYYKKKLTKKLLLHYCWDSTIQWISKQVWNVCFFNSIVYLRAFCIYDSDACCGAGISFMSLRNTGQSNGPQWVYTIQLMFSVRVTLSRAPMMLCSIKLTIYIAS